MRVFSHPQYRSLAGLEAVSAAVPRSPQSRFATFVLMAASCYLGARWGLRGEAPAIVAAELLMTLVMAVIVVRQAGIPLESLFQPRPPVFEATMVMAARVLSYRYAGAPAIGLRSPAMLANSIARGAVLHVATPYLTRNAVVSEAVGEPLTEAHPLLQDLRR